MSAILKNCWLTAEFAAESGNLLVVRGPDGTAAVKGCWTGWTRGGKAFHENPAVEAERFAVRVVRATADGIESVIATEDAEVLRRFDLPPDSPLLRVHYEVRALRPGVELERPVALPEVALAEDFANQYEDDEDLYFDGEEVGDGRELPPWRVFFRGDHRTGLIAAARCKLEMSHFQVLERSFAIKPHIMTAYSTDFVLAYSPVRFAASGGEAGAETGAAWHDRPEDYGKTALGPREVHSADFEIGPWRREDHESILKAARLDRPSERRNPPLSGAAPTGLKGIVFRCVEVADAASVSAEYRPDRWMSVAMPHCAGGRALFCGASVRPPPIVLAPNLRGVYRVYAGIGNGDGIMAQFSGDPAPILRLPHGRAAVLNPFPLRLSGPQTSREVLLKTGRMDGQTVELRRLPAGYAVTILDYLRFEPLTDVEAAEWEETERREPILELSGFNDIPDIAHFDDPRNPDPALYKANLWEHARCKVRKVYWRIDGQCSDFPSRHNTMRYVSAKVHGLFSPQSKAYGRALKKANLLRLAVDAARRHGLKLYGWQRFNNYGGNVQSEFFVRHPEYHEANDKGWRLNKLCLAHPEVRRHKMDILCEAAGYGLDGLNLGFLRHPPVLHYAPILVEGFRAAHGKAPPPEPSKEDAARIMADLDAHPLYKAWYRHRAGFLTTFGRELRAALKERGLGGVKVSIWVRPEMCLYDGIDLDAWLEEGLCDEVVASSTISAVLNPPPVEWRRKVQSRVPLIYTVSGFDIENARAAIPTVLRDGYDGLCVYESDYAVLEDDFIALFRDLRSPTLKRRAD